MCGKRYTPLGDEVRNGAWCHAVRVLRATSGLAGDVDGKLLGSQNFVEGNAGRPLVASPANYDFDEGHLPRKVTESGEAEAPATNTHRFGSLATERLHRTMVAVEETGDNAAVLRPTGEIFERRVLAPDLDTVADADGRTIRLINRIHLHRPAHGRRRVDLRSRGERTTTVTTRGKREGGGQYEKRRNVAVHDRLLSSPLEGYLRCSSVLKSVFCRTAFHTLSKKSSGYAPKRGKRVDNQFWLSTRLQKLQNPPYFIMYAIFTETVPSSFSASVIFTSALSFVA